MFVVIQYYLIKKKKKKCFKNYKMICQKMNFAYLLLHSTAPASSCEPMNAVTKCRHLTPLLRLLHLRHYHLLVGHPKPHIRTNIICPRLGLLTFLFPPGLLIATRKAVRSLASQSRAPLILTYPISDFRLCLRNTVGHIRYHLIRGDSSLSLYYIGPYIFIKIHIFFIQYIFIFY